MIARCFTLMLCALPFLLPVSASADDYRKAEERIRSGLLAGKLLPAPEVGKLLEDQNPDGSWKDIDYDSQIRSNWYSAGHLRRVRDLARLWAKPDQPYFHNPEVGDAVRRAVAEWSAKKRQCVNWWWNDIYVPEAMADTLLMASDLFPDDEKKAALGIVRQAKFGMTGQNRVWVASIVFKRALLERDRPTMRKAVSEITSELRLSDEEGIRPDGSFHQHGKQIQFGNYGSGFLGSISYWAGIFQGTPLEFTPEQWKLLELLVFDGYQWVLWNGRMDYLASGRQLGRGTLRGKADGALRSIERLGGCDPSRKPEYKALLERNREGGRNTLTGNRHFWNSDYMVHRRPEWYGSVRMNSVETAPIEDYVNWDNALGRYLSDGATTVMVTGDEYEDIPVAWDWTRLPGTTLPATPILTEEECRKLNVKTSGFYPRWTLSRKFRYGKGESTFTGGASDGRHGAAVYSMDLDGVKAKKAYFFDDGAIYALGCDITSASPYPVATTVEANLHNGEVIKGDNHFWHNRIGYVGKNMAAETKVREGDWRYIDGGRKDPLMEKKDIFTLTIDHGVKPRNASYEYTILPGATPEETAAHPGARVLANNGKLQAVEFADGTRGAIFHAPGTLGDFTADRPGIYLIGPAGYFYTDPAVKAPAEYRKR